MVSHDGVTPSILVNSAKAVIRYEVSLRRDVINQTRRLQFGGNLGEKAVTPLSPLAYPFMVKG